MDSAHVNWMVSVCELSIGFVFALCPCWYLLYRWRAEHHIITLACLTLLIPDTLMIVCIVPVHVNALIRGELIDDTHCQLTAFALDAALVASLGANVCVAYVTKRMLDPSDGKAKVYHVVYWSMASWSCGLLMSTFFYSAGYLGVHRGMYCGTKSADENYMARALFLCLGIAVTAMVYYYHQTYKQITKVAAALRNNNKTDGSRTSTPYQQPALHTVIPITTKGVDKHRRNKDSISILPATAAATGMSTTGMTGDAVSSNLPALPNVQEVGRASSMPTETTTMTEAAARQSKATITNRFLPNPVSFKPSFSMSASPPSLSPCAVGAAKRGTLMVGICFLCWSGALLNIADIPLSKWSDCVGQILLQLHPSLDALVVIMSICRVHQRKQAKKDRGSPASEMRDLKHQTSKSVTPLLPDRRLHTATRKLSHTPSHVLHQPIAVHPRASGIEQERQGTAFSHNTDAVIEGTQHESNLVRIDSHHSLHRRSTSAGLVLA